MSKSKEKKHARGSSSTSEEDVTDTMILEKLSSIHADVKASKDELKSEIQAFKSELSGKSLNAVWEEVQSLKQKNKDIQDQCDAATRENSKLNEKISTLKNRLIKLEDYSRRENLRLYNIPENPGENSVECSRKAMDVLSELGADPENTKFHAIHRTGNPNTTASSNSAVSAVSAVSNRVFGADPENTKFHAIHRTGNPNTTASSNSAVSNRVSTESTEGASRPPRPRPILVRFVSRMDSDWVWENRKKLMNSSHFSSVFIDKDLSAESAKQRGKLRTAFRKAKELNIGKVFIKGKNL